MARYLLLAVLLCVPGLAMPGLAQAEPLAAVMIPAADAAQWNAVGRLNIAGNRHCTATLIAPDQVITAAHCLFHPVTHARTDPTEIRFVAGFRQGSYAALVAVSASAILPGYVVTDGAAGTRQDIALLRLSRPVLPTEATPLAVQDWPQGTAVDIVGYGRDRPQIASIRQGCAAEAVAVGLMLGCAVLPGLSGAPVVMSGGQGVVAVVSASVGPRVAGVRALAVPVAPHLAELRALLP